MVDDLYSRLAAQFPTETHKRVSKGGGTQTYVPWNDVAERLNLELGVLGWSFVVVREGFTKTECWVLGEITATVDGVTVKRQQYGCEPITMGQKETPTSDLLKKATSDALKKTAQLLGVGLYLSDAEDRAEVEADMREQARGGNRPAAKPTPLKPQVPKPSRDELVRAYSEAARLAVDLGHAQANKLIESKPDEMADETLAEVAAKLARWIAAQPKQAAG